MEAEAPKVVMAKAVDMDVLERWQIGRWEGLMGNMAGMVRPSL